MTTLDKYIFYNLIDKFLSNKLSAEDFANTFVCYYNVELANIELLPEEEESFAELNKVASRFSPFEKDLQKYPGTYCSQDQLRQKALEIRKKINKHSTTLR